MTAREIIIENQAKEIYNLPGVASINDFGALPEGIKGEYKTIAEYFIKKVLAARIEELEKLAKLTDDWKTREKIEARIDQLCRDWSES